MKLSTGDTVRVHGRVMLPGMVVGDWRVTDILGEPSIYFLTRGNQTLRFWYSEVDPFVFKRSTKSHYLELLPRAKVGVA